MGYRDLAAMKKALKGKPVTGMERAVLLDMATALQNSIRYSWGHDRLAEAIGKTPGTPAAKQALSGRIIPSLIAKGLIVKITDAHRGINAEYDLVVLRPEPVENSGMGNGADAAMGNASDPEWVTDSRGMGNAQTGTPAKGQRQGQRGADAPTTCPRHPEGNSSEPCRSCMEARKARAAQPTISAPFTVQPGWRHPGISHRPVPDGTCRLCDARPEEVAADLAMEAAR